MYKDSQSMLLTTNQYDCHLSTWADTISLSRQAKPHLFSSGTEKFSSSRDRYYEFQDKPTFFSATSKQYNSKVFHEIVAFLLWPFFCASRAVDKGEIFEAIIKALIV